MKTTIVLPVIYGISLSLFLSASASALADSAKKGQLPSPDQKFVDDAVAGGRAQVELGQMAQGKAADPNVREFGQRMAQDHQKANDQLWRILEERGITESGSGTETSKTAERLQNERGADFDRAYMKDMVKEHKTDVAAFKKEAADGRDPEIRYWAAQTLPTLEEHLKMAEQTQQSMSR